LAWSPDGRQIACTTILDPVGAGSTAQVTVWAADGGTVRQTISLAQQKQGTSWYPCAWSPDSKTLALSSPDFAIGLWDPLGERAARTLPVRHTNWVHALAWSPDSKLLVSFAQEGWVWDAVAGQPLRQLTGPRGMLGHVVALAWSPNGEPLASVNGDWDDVDLWDVGSGKQRERLEGHKGRPTTVAWSPSGEILASGGADRTVRLWKKNGKFATDLAHDQQGKVAALAWLDDKTLATFGSNNRLCVWDVVAKTLRSSAKIPGTGKGRFSPDGLLLASLDDPAGVRLWETTTGRPRGTLFLPRPGAKQWVAISAEGHYRAESPQSQWFDRDFVYVVWTEQGQDLLTPEEFATKYRKNDPDAVHLLGK
jgi:WD40 repeat protein